MLRTLSIYISIHKMCIINKLWRTMAVVREMVERVKKKPSEMGLNWMNKAGLQFLPGISCQHNKPASERAREWASESEINEYYDGNDNNTTASQWKITTPTIINGWLRHDVHRNFPSEALDWMTVRKFIENKQSLISGELFYFCCCFWCVIGCVSVPS